MFVKMASPFQKTEALATLTANYTDSEGEAESDKEDTFLSKKEEIKPPASKESTPRSTSEMSTSSIQDKRPISKLVSYIGEMEEEDEEMEEEYLEKGDSSDEASRNVVSESDEKSNEDSRKSIKPDLGKKPMSPISFHRTLLDMDPGDIEIPAEPPGRCSNTLQEKIARLYEKKLREEKDMNISIQGRKDFRNPSIYEKLIAFCGIDEMGTNYPPEIYDPHKWGPESFYEELAKRQKEEMDKKEKERKERTKVEFISGTAKKPSDQPAVTEKRKSKWDVGAGPVGIAAGVIKPTTIMPPAVVPVSAATGTKPTVISAFGTITKKAKQ
ncbi:SAP30-binding protein-like [Limulus polyphemus]|uniref:SAP30-binding protein-like n=1 Tax=Limulus polyphemus TaxID=6850 RepID=A0ABM1T3W2_LIMPO|nr:SAP30-binding protein-like [Limulus polyphemus]